MTDEDKKAFEDMVKKFVAAYGLDKQTGQKRPRGA